MIHNLALATALALIGGITGAAVYRWFGVNHKWFPKNLIALIFAIPFGLCAPGWSFLVICPWIFFFIVMAHGRFQSLKEPMSGDPEPLEAFTLKFYKDLSVYWYKVACLCFQGTLTTMPSAMAMQDPYIFFSGAIGRPLAYMIGWQFFKTTRFVYGIEIGPTAIGEMLTGFFYMSTLIFRTFI